jgi:hypothetical protein
MHVHTTVLPRYIFTALLPLVLTHPPRLVLVHSRDGKRENLGRGGVRIMDLDRVESSQVKMSQVELSNVASRWITVATCVHPPSFGYKPG